jgi:hypothetical protein
MTSSRHQCIRYMKLRTSSPWDQPPGDPVEVPPPAPRVVSAASDQLATLRSGPNNLAAHRRLRSVWLAFRNRRNSGRPQALFGWLVCRGIGPGSGARMPDGVVVAHRGSCGHHPGGPPGAGLASGVRWLAGRRAGSAARGSCADVSTEFTAIIEGCHQDRGRPGNHPRSDSGSDVLLSFRWGLALVLNGMEERHEVLS